MRRIPALMSNFTQITHGKCVIYASQSAVLTPRLAQSVIAFYSACILAISCPSRII